MKLSLRKKLAVGSALFLLALPALAQAPQALSIIVNGVALQGKALNYKGRLYVPLEDVAIATGGTFNRDPQTGVVTATVPSSPMSAAPMPAPLPPPIASRRGEAQRPFIKVLSERKYTDPSNARVMATITNQGQLPAQNVEMICTFKGNQREIASYVQNLGTLNPGELKTLEFRLFEGQTDSDRSPAVGAVPDDKVLINGQWTRVSYEFHFNYQ